MFITALRAASVPQLLLMTWTSVRILLAPRRARTCLVGEPHSAVHGLDLHPSCPLTLITTDIFEQEDQSMNRLEDRQSLLVQAIQVILQNMSLGSTVSPLPTTCRPLTPRSLSS